MKFIKRLIIFLFLITLLLGGILLYSFQLAPRLVALEEVNIQDSGVTKPMTIVLIADTHFSHHYSPRDFQKAVNKINSQDPDLVIFWVTFSTISKVMPVIRLPSLRLWPG